MGHEAISIFEQINLSFIIEDLCGIKNMRVF